jgi:hypothetical protein
MTIAMAQQQVQVAGSYSQRVMVDGAEKKMEQL